MKLFKRNILSNNKGITIIFVALLAFVLFAFAALAVDVAYFYVAKNELQVAADAAALAGAARLSDTSSLTQNTARDEVVNFAKKNKVVGKLLTISNSGDNSLGNNNDITVGNWNGTIYTPGVTPVNAVQVRTRRTENSPDGAVGVFFGRFLGWELMNIRAEAIASMPPRPSSGVSLCYRTCPGNSGLTTPNINPAITDNFSPSRVLSSTGNPDSDKGIAWTDFTVTQPNPVKCNDNCNVIPTVCDNKNEEVASYIWQLTTPSYACNTVSTNQGAGSVIKDLECAFMNPNFDTNNKIGGTWKVITPVLGPLPGKDPCPAGKQPDAFPIVGFAEIEITNVYATGPNSNTVHIRSIRCIPCGDWTLLGHKPVLVR